MAHAHHAAHAYVHHIKVRKEESSQGDLKTKAMLSKASSGNKNFIDRLLNDINRKIKILIYISSQVSLKVCLQSTVKKNVPRIFAFALQAAGADVSKHPVAASDWGHTLEKNGYKKIKPAFNRPQEGDIYIIERTSGHTYGHIAGYTGNGWFSDFRQKTYAVYKEKDVKYSYYRLDS